MYKSFLKFVSTTLILCLSLLPFQAAQAALVGTQQAITANHSQSQRDQIRVFLSRAEVKQQLQALGVDPNAAQQRVDALTDQEVQQIAGKLNALPAGAVSGWAVAAGIAVIAVILYFIYR